MYYEITDDAENDIHNIYDYGLENWGMLKADEYRDAIYTAIEFVAENPTFAKPLKDDFFTYTVKSHSIIGRFVNDTFEVMQVVRILHGKALPSNYL